MGPFTPIQSPNCRPDIAVGLLILRHIGSLDLELRFARRGTKILAGWGRWSEIRHKRISKIPYFMREQCTKMPEPNHERKGTNMTLGTIINNQ